MPSSHSKGKGQAVLTLGQGRDPGTYPQGTRWPELPRCSCWSRTWSRPGSRWWSGSTSAERRGGGSRAGQTCQRTSPGHYRPTKPPPQATLPLPQDRPTRCCHQAPSPGWQDCVPELGSQSKGPQCPRRLSGLRDGQSALTCQGSQQKSICLSYNERRKRVRQGLADGASRWHESLSPGWWRGVSLLLLSEVRALPTSGPAPRPSVTVQRKMLWGGGEQWGLRQEGSRRRG